MGGDFQFNLDTEKLESVQSLLARNAPILDLLQNKVLKAQITRGTLVTEAARLPGRGLEPQATNLRVRNYVHLARPLPVPRARPARRRRAR